MNSFLINLNTGNSLTATKIIGIAFICLFSIGCVTISDNMANEKVDISSGRIKEAQFLGAPITEIAEFKKGAPKRWMETLDKGDDPLKPGCACLYEFPACGGGITGRAVDECFPKDGVTLNEKVISPNCSSYEDKTYNCETLLGKGARCKLIELTCCGVRTTSAQCDIDITN
ncbi:MAG: hypothetical protein ACFHVJ_11460 [Aestuariibacter sp.]